MTIKADLGFINIAPEVLADIAGYAAMSCFGVKGMTIRSVSDGIAHLLRRENMSRGVRITEAEDGGVNIDLHLAVEHGVNIGDAALCQPLTCTGLIQHRICCSYYLSTVDVVEQIVDVQLTNSAAANYAKL